MGIRKSRRETSLIVCTLLALSMGGGVGHSQGAPPSTGQKMPPSGLALRKTPDRPGYPYQDSRLPVELRVKDLLSRMSLTEKIRQMDMYKGENFLQGNAFSEEKALNTAGRLGVGAIHDVYPKDTATINALQSVVLRSNRWGIPALVMAEMLHGYLEEGSTAFPMNIGLASTWDRDLIFKVGRAVATEARGKGVHFGLGPNLDLGREPRWGRVAETFGEDTYLASEMGLAYVQGLKGTSLAARDSIIAEPKHFAVHGIPQTGGNASPAVIGERAVRQEHLPTFEKAIRKGGALGVMCAYSELDGVPCAANAWLLTDVLRKEWGFDGLVVSDLGAIKYLQTTHHVTSSPKDSIRAAISAGVDMQFYDFPNDFFQKTVAELVQEGALTQAHIDRAAGAVLRLKFRLGLFENPYTDVAPEELARKKQEHRQLALRAGLESICLLKNEQGLLPIKQARKIAVIGPNADRSVLGGYSVRDKRAVTVLEGIRQIAPPGVQVTYQEGTPLLDMGEPIESSCLFTPDKAVHGLKGEYFNNPELEGTPACTRVDANVTFDWPWFPAPGVNDDGFSVRWTGYLRPDNRFGNRLGVSADDGIRLFIDDSLVIDHWGGVTNISTAEVDLQPRRDYKLRLEMWEGGGGARAHLRFFPRNRDLSPAIELAKGADLAVVVLGESEELVEENRDVSSLDLQGRQLELIEAVRSTGTPTVCVLLNGRPLSIREISAKVPAILEAWFPGEQLGLAVAKVLFGEYNPGGRLPVTFQESAGQLPAYYSTKPSAIHRYIDAAGKSLFPFGHGLSYTTFRYANLQVFPQRSPDGYIQVSVEVSNTGDREGDEVVQLYIRDLVSSVTTPLKLLKGFERITLKKGETRTVTFHLTPEELSLWNADMKRVVEAGSFEVRVGGSSEDLITGRFEITKNLSLSREGERP